MKHIREIRSTKNLGTLKILVFYTKAKKSNLKTVFVKVKWQIIFQLKILSEPAQNSIPLVWTLYVCIKIMCSGCNYWKRVSKCLFKRNFHDHFTSKTGNWYQTFWSKLYLILILVLTYSWSGCSYRQISGWQCNIGC